MVSSELIELIQRNDKAAKKQVFDLYYGRMAGIASRYAKNQSQAGELLNAGFNHCFHALQNSRQAKISDPNAFFEKEFITSCVAFIKNLRSEYYVASTVYAVEMPTKNYDLFENNDLIDFNQVDTAVVIKALQQLVPAQRMVFNLHVIDGYSLSEIGVILETNEETIKSNLEKARYNLQKNIEHGLKALMI